MSILTFLTQSADLYAPTIGANGLTEYSGTASASGVKTRIEPSGREIRQADGAIITVDARIFLPAGTTIAEQYKIVVDSISYIVDRVDPMRELAAISHYECYCRKI